VSSVKQYTKFNGNIGRSRCNTDWNIAIHCAPSSGPILTNWSYCGILFPEKRIKEKPTDTECTA
jgi:hypothetical protein